MSGFLFDEIIFGPVFSRRLGISLGVNLLPKSYKYCTFNCIYCECGWTLKKEGKLGDLPAKQEFIDALERTLVEMSSKSKKLDVITFAGNGEPTIHPEFKEIIGETILLRDKYYPNAGIAVLSNSTLIKEKSVFEALKLIDKNILKLDAGTEEMFKRINKPLVDISLKEIKEQIKKFDKKVIIQSLFLKGEHEGKLIDNTTEEELCLWLEHIKEIQPELVMIYPFARQTPAEKLEKISKEKLQEIATRVEALGISTEVYD